MTHRKAKRRRHESGQNRRGLWLMGTAILLVVIGIATWPWVNPSSPASQTTVTDPTKLGPRLALNTERVDLGRQPFDKTVRAEFKVQNTGDQPLMLDASTPVRVVEGC